MNLLAGKRWFSWTRLLGVAGTLLLLWVVFSRVEFGSFAEALKRTRLGWCGLAFALYGISLAIQSYRWHSALRTMDRAIHLAASWRLAMVGHFFFTVFFGMAGGDAAKSALYAKWFRFALPEVIAAAPLDRGLSLGGAIIVALVTWGLAVLSGGMDVLGSLPMQGPGFWVLAGISLAVIIGVLVIFWRPRGESAWARTLRAFRQGGGRMALSPRLAGSGLFVATLGHLSLSGVFALNLLAVSSTSLAWSQIAWTFPAITIISCVPFTVAGAGVREVAAVTLLGLYEVPAGDCVAAAMLTMVHKLAWAGVGAGVLWREQALQESRSEAFPERRSAAVPAASSGGVSSPGRTPGGTPDALAAGDAYAVAFKAPLRDSGIVKATRAGFTPAGTISIVMPVLNEAELLPETIQRARANPEVCEIIVVDGGSRDATPHVAEQLGCRVLASPPGRGGQMRLGASQATGEIVMLLHADTWLPANAGHVAFNCLRDGTVVAGGFWKVFRDPPLLLRGARFKCWLRLALGRRILGDQAMFIRREVLERIGGVPDMDLMEDFDLSRRLREVGRLALAEATVTTSARRFKKLGVLRTYLRMARVTAGYRAGTPVQALRRMYEKD